MAETIPRPDTTPSTFGEETTWSYCGLGSIFSSESVNASTTSVAFRVRIIEADSGPGAETICVLSGMEAMRG